MDDVIACGSPEQLQWLQTALEKSNYVHQLKYDEITPIKRRRHRKVIFYNPPFCKSVTTNVCKTFMELVKKHFANGHKYEKIFNKNKLRVSYCCMPNIRSRIIAHNNKTMSELENVGTKKGCNCRKKNECPVANRCQEENVVYRANIKSDHEEKLYVGLAGNTFTMATNQVSTTKNTERAQLYLGFKRI